MFRDGPLPRKVGLMWRDSQLLPRRDEDDVEEAVVVAKREGSWHCGGFGNRGGAVTFDILEQK